MAVLYVTEYINTNAQNTYPNEPSTATQTVAIGSTSTATTNAFQSNTTLVRLSTDAVCSVSFGTSPTATVTSQRLAANTDRLVTVPQGSGLKVAVITNT